MPVSRYRVRLVYRSGALHPVKHHHRSRHRDGCGGMHHNAKWAVVAIRIYRMDVRYLNNGQQSQEQDAHQGDHRQST